jgi:cytochrome c-type biogenesis protein
VLSGFLNHHKRGLELFSGAFVIAMGLLLLSGERLPMLLRERRFYLRPGGGVVRTFLLGMAFAFGWTPCIGPTLGAALNLAATSHGLASGIGLLFAYSLGIGTPFVLAGLGLVSFGGRLKRYAATIQLLGGALLIGVGVLLLSGQLTQITIWMQKLLTRAHLNFWNV